MACSEILDKIFDRCGDLGYQLKIDPEEGILVSSLPEEMRRAIGADLKYISYSEVGSKEYSNICISIRSKYPLEASILHRLLLTVQVSSKIFWKTLFLFW